MQLNERTISRAPEAILATNKVIRNTYSLLSMTLLFSALTAGISVVANVSSGASLISFIVAIALVWFVLPRTANSGAGIFVVFAFTGLLGFALGPMLNQYLALENGPRLIGMALGGTGVIFLALSGYALTTRQNFSFLGGFLFIGFFVVLGAIVLGFFFDIPGLQLAISAAIILIMSGFILYDTSNIIHGGETNYLNATVSLYMSVFNIFVHLLSLLGVLGGDD